MTPSPPGVRIDSISGSQWDGVFAGNSVRGQNISFNDNRVYSMIMGSQAVNLLVLFELQQESDNAKTKFEEIALSLQTQQDLPSSTDINSSQTPNLFSFGVIQRLFETWEASARQYKCDVAELVEIVHSRSSAGELLGKIAGLLDDAKRLLENGASSNPDNAKTLETTMSDVSDKVLSLITLFPRSQPEREYTERLISNPASAAHQHPVFPARRGPITEEHGMPSDGPSSSHRNAAPGIARHNTEPVITTDQRLDGDVYGKLTVEGGFAQQGNTYDAREIPRDPTDPSKPWLGPRNQYGDVVVKAGGSYHGGNSFTAVRRPVDNTPARLGRVNSVPANTSAFSVPRDFTRGLHVPIREDPEGLSDMSGSYYGGDDESSDNREAYSRASTKKKVYATPR